MHPRAEAAFDEQAGAAIAMFVRGWIVVIVFFLLWLAPLLVLIEASNAEHLAMMRKGMGNAERYALRDRSNVPGGMGITQAGWDSVWAGK